MFNYIGSPKSGEGGSETSSVSSPGGRKTSTSELPTLPDKKAPGISFPLIISFISY